MITNLWYGILDAKEVKAGKLSGVTRMNEKLVLWRTADGKLACIADQCCHRGASLCIGKYTEAGVACPFHGFVYDASGMVILIPANGKNTPVGERYKVKSYHVEEKYGLIWLWYGDPLASKPEIPFFEDLRQDFVYSGFSETWPVHYTRAIENQLDVVHLPFVHGDTIGRGNHTLVHGPVVTWDQERMTFYVNNVLDDGKTKPMKAEEMPDYEIYFSLQFQMPNLWQNRISDKVRIVAVFAPIDESHTRIYIRFYQRFFTIPILKELLTPISNWSNRHVLHQDRRVVSTQIPIRTELTMGENLIPGDRPILEYRKRRAQLKGEYSRKPE
ncbi:MAG: aromatic ring-hydroxylating dioxygenase subunit alpha [Erysipelotrichaceae bacterium]